ncbi:MAG: Type secretion outer membrane protein TolC [Polaromonas sp.]|nr:Type secretion outer membrane protein TolC [Polaromonas sp.]
MRTLPFRLALTCALYVASLTQAHSASAGEVEAAPSMATPRNAAGQAPGASTLSLLQAYEAALQNDATYRAAIHENQAGQEFKVLGRAHLLPLVSASYATHKNRADITTELPLGDRTERRNYTSQAGSVQLRQPLFYPEGHARHRQGIAQTHASNAQFVLRGQDLIVRLATVYVAAQYAHDQLQLATAQRDAYAQQRLSANRMFESGEGTRTDVLEAQAKFDVADAQVIEAGDNLVNASDALAAMIGRNAPRLERLTDDFQIKPMLPAGFEEWKQMALDNNAEILALRIAVDIAREEIKKIEAGHTPRLDLVASAGKNSSDTVNTLNQSASSLSVGLQLNIPLYAGGSVSAAVRQAVANYEKAQADLEATSSQVLVELRKQYNLTQSSVARVKASETSLRSTRLLVEATQKSIQGGQRTTLDVLNAQQQFFEAKRDLALARFNYLLSFLRLRYSAGTVGRADLNTIATYFVADK